MKIVVLDGNALNPGDLSWDGFKEYGEFILYDRTSYITEDKDLIIERAKEADILITNKTPLNREILESLPKLKYIGILATGFNVVDIKAAKELGIAVTNIPAYSTSAVAQMTFALLLEICNHVGLHNEEVKKEVWTNCSDFCFWSYPLIELSGKTMGIIGFGNIGKEVSKIAAAFNINVLVYSNHENKEMENEKFKFVALDELLSTSDIISLHCPLNEKTKGMINKKAIAQMKDGVTILNTARGALIAEEDLAEALNSGKVSGAGLDVITVEPINADNPLLKAKNCIITPHISWAPKETRERLMNIAVNNLKQFLLGEPKNVIN